MKKNVGSTSRITRREIERKLSSTKKIRTKDLRDVLNKMKYNLTSEISYSILSNLDFETRNYLIGCPLPSKYSDLRTKGISNFKYSFQYEINWISMTIRLFASEINLFLTLEREFEKEFLLGNYMKCHDIINKIDTDISYSHWSIEKKLLLAEYFPEGKSKSELIDIVKNSTERLIKINSSYQSIRFENQLPPNRYDEIIEKFALKQKNRDVASYFLFRLNYYNNLIIEYPEIALYLESNLSIIDRYQILLQVSTSLVCAKFKKESYLEFLYPCLVSINELVDDIRLNNILAYGGYNSHKSYSEDTDFYLHILSNFNTDNFKQCFDNSLEFLNSKPYLMEVAELLIKSAIILNCDCPKIGRDDSVINRVLLSLFNIYTKNVDYEISMYNLNKIAKSISCPLWCSYLINIINQEQSIVLSNYKFDLHKIISSYSYNPEILLHISNIEVKKSYSDLFENFRDFYVSIYWGQENENYSQDLSENKGIFSGVNTIKSFDFQNNYMSALDQLIKISELEKYKEILKIPFVNLDLIKRKIYYYHKTEKVIEALELTCLSVINNDKYYYALNDSELINKVLTSDSEQIHHNICTPIIARLYKEKTNDIWIAYDNFMYSNNYIFPKELFNSDKYKPDLLKYFLSQVCIQDIYDSSPDYNSPEELDDERIAICNYLCLNDEENKDSYINEITSIETRALIKKGIKEIDESKIYVDTSGILREIENDIKERFTRGQELLKLNKDEIDYLLEMSSSVLYLFLPKSDEEGSVIKFDKSIDRQDSIMSHPHFVNFKENFLLIRDRFISSNEFGLDSYISMRIRHGTLLGQIRSIFERYNLITKKNTHTKQYIDNDFWISKLGASKNKSGVSEKLNNFSEKIDLMSEQIKNSFLQIKTEDKASDGLFDYKFDDSELVKLYETKFYSIEKHQVFYDTAIESLWKRTEINLNVIREKFTNEFSKNTIEYLNDLSSSIEKFKKKDAIDTNEFLRDITACKTDTTNAFEKISLWFRRSYSNSINEFDMKLVTTTCFSIVNKMHPQTPILSPSIQISSEVIIQGKYFTFFIDIMRNILDNIIVRSEIIEPELKVSLNVSEEKGKLVINIENNVSKNLDILVANQRIATTQYRIDNTNNDSLLKKEGGTGYLKIKNILTKILKRKNYILKLEQIKDNRIFKSCISFELEDLTK